MTKHPRVRLTACSRYHDFSAGHRVAGHESACASLHGHNYRVHFRCVAPELDRVGRVIDFSAIKARLCQWLEDNWDHRFLVWENDPLLPALIDLDSAQVQAEDRTSLVVLPFNPTAENMAEHLLHHVGPDVLGGTDVTLYEVELWETRKCYVSAGLVP